jgi:choline dehydrogenase-like flavoprotein
VKETQYDAIVVGSGISGGWAAKELTERGLNVLLLERGRMVHHGVDYTTEGKAPYNFRFHLLGDQREDSREHAVQSTCAHFTEATSHFFVNDRLNPYTTDADKPFKWIRGHQLGGRSLTWGRQCYRMGPLNFEDNARDGNGVDWPVRYDDIAPWYSHVEKFIGVSGEAIGSATAPDGEFQKPMGFNAPELEFQRRVASSFSDRQVTMGRLANLTEPLPGRAPCQMRNACARGCSWGGYFSSLSSTLPAAQATGRLTTRTDSIVHSVIYDARRRRARGVRVIDAKTHRVRDYEARIVFLCASAFESVRILLNSKSPDFPRGMANSSGTLGHFIMDHFPSDLGIAEIDGPEMPNYSGARPGPLLIPRFRNVTGPAMNYVRGYQMHAGASPGSWTRGLRAGSGVGAELKQSLRRPGPWTLILIAQGETLPRYENRVQLDPHVKDAWGMPALHIRMTYGDNELAMRREATQTVHEILDATGYRNYRMIPIVPLPGDAIHEMGGARMGRDPKTSVLNGFNQAHDVQNLFVTDGSAMASSSNANPSLTYMALTARACANAVEILKRGDI